MSGGCRARARCAKPRRAAARIRRPDRVAALALGTRQQSGREPLSASAWRTFCAASPGACRDRPRCAPSACRSPTPSGSRAGPTRRGASSVWPSDRQISSRRDIILASRPPSNPGRLTPTSARCGSQPARAPSRARHPDSPPATLPRGRNVTLIRRHRPAEAQQAHVGCSRLDRAARLEALRRARLERPRRAYTAAMSRSSPGVDRLVTVERYAGSTSPPVTATSALSSPSTRRSQVHGAHPIRRRTTVVTSRATIARRPGRSAGAAASAAAAVPRRPRRVADHLSPRQLVLKPREVPHAFSKRPPTSPCDCRKSSRRSASSWSWTRCWDGEAEPEEQAVHALMARYGSDMDHVPGYEHPRPVRAPQPAPDRRRRVHRLGTEPAARNRRRCQLLPRGGSSTLGGWTSGRRSSTGSDGS